MDTLVDSPSPEEPEETPREMTWPEMVAQYRESNVAALTAVATKLRHPSRRAKAVFRVRTR